MIELIAFDADDTLWHSEMYYQEGQARFADWMAAYQPDRQQVLEVLHRIEIANLPSFGYGVKGFAFSMIETALELSRGEVSGKDIQKIVALAREMLSNDIRLLEGVREAVEELAKSYPLMLITKGDLIDQERKIANSGLAPCFRTVEIVSDKNPRTYRQILEKHHLKADTFLMVGNSLKSDVLPVVELGGYGVYVPYQVTWAHEQVEALPEGLQRFYEIKDLHELPGLVKKLESVH